MIWLLLSIALSASIVLIFRAFPHYQIHTGKAIRINYATCLLLGNLLLGRDHIFQADLPQQAWFYPALGMGVLFITVFSAMGFSARHAGASFTALASKMGLLMPVLTGVFLLGEPQRWNLIPGLLLTLVAIWLLTPQKPGETHEKGWTIIILPLVFIGSGFVDTGLKLIQHHFLQGGPAIDTARSTTLIFGSAFVCGMLASLIGRETLLPGPREWLGGLVLGTVNYFSVYALLRALNSDGLPASVFFPVNNLGVVLLALLLSEFLYKEKPDPRQKAGIGISLLAILLLSL